MEYGITVYAHGVRVRTDQRPRFMGKDGKRAVIRFETFPNRARRGKVREFSDRSRRELAFKAANMVGPFRSLLTLTYHAAVDEQDLAAKAERNRSVAQRAKRDLNRFLSSLRSHLGGYLWVLEFQERGAVHFHVLCERVADEVRVACAWMRATGQLDDPAAWKHGAQVEVIENERGVRCYASEYVGKLLQKALALGVEHPGRWWGCSRSMPMAVLERVVTSEHGAEAHDHAASQVVRRSKRWIGRAMKRKFRSGSFPIRGDKFTRKLAEVVRELKRFHGVAGIAGGVGR